MSTHILHSARDGLLHDRGAGRRTHTDPAKLAAVVLFAVVVIAQAVFIALHWSSIADIGSLYLATT